MNPKTLLSCVALVLACVFNISADTVAQSSKTSGIYLTAATRKSRDRFRGKLSIKSS